MRTKKASSWFNAHRTLVLVIAFILFVLMVLFAAVIVQAPGSQKTVPPEGGVSLEGTLTCLPHKDTSGPQTLECAIGLKSGEEYYALKDQSADGSQFMSIPFNETVVVSGTLQYEDSDIYQTSGTITVDDISQAQ